MKQRKADFQEIVRTYLWQVRWSIFLSVLFMVGLTLTELLSPWPLKIIFDYILLDKPLPHSLSWLAGMLQSGKVFSVIVTSLSIILIAGFSGLFAYFQHHLISGIG